MAKNRKGGLINRLIVGKEKSEEYARASLPSNRWELFWDIFKGKFWKLVLVNLLTFLFFIPLILLLYFRTSMIISNGAYFPFGQGFGLGYGAPTSMAGMAEGIIHSTNLIVYLFLPVAVAIACVGISGGAYVIRNVVWTEGDFIVGDFWHGVKVNYKQVLIIGLLFSLMFYLTTCFCSLADQYVATGAELSWLWITGKVIAIAILIFYSFMTAHMVTMSVTYQYKIWHLLRNSFLFTVGLFPLNLFFGAICAAPFLLSLIGGIVQIIVLVLVALLAISFALLVWTDFCQWAYDSHINTKIGAKKNRGIYEKVKKDNDKKKVEAYKNTLERNTATQLYSKPIKPITDDEIQLAQLPEAFTRADLEKLRESKEIIYEEDRKYVLEHQNNPENIEAIKTQEQLEAERQKRIEKAKRELAKRKKR